MKFKLVENLILESLEDEGSLNYHYDKHVLQPGEWRIPETASKYEYMTKEEYKQYADELNKANPDYIIDTWTHSKMYLSDIMKEVEDWLLNHPKSILKINLGQLNHESHKRVEYKIRNYSPQRKGNWFDFCIVDYNTQESVTIYAIRIKAILKYIELNIKNFVLR